MQFSLVYLYFDTCIWRVLYRLFHLEFMQIVRIHVCILILNLLKCPFNGRTDARNAASMHMNTKYTHLDIHMNAEEDTVSRNKEVLYQTLKKVPHQTLKKV